ncbi:MAG: CoA pyrophosphatase [Rhodothermales bacterium]|nr:CoA pyrophosphatase [Rhodothermales bacterium]
MPAEAPIHSFETTVAFLRRRLAEPLPGTEAQLAMAPLYRQDATMARVDGKPCREAGVLALVFPLAGEPALLLTVRRDDLPDHPGQVSFPGGRREPGETLREAALREAHEEVGLHPGAVEVLGPLTPLYIPPSNFCVYPFVGVAAVLPALRPQDAEVEALLPAPLPHLLDPATHRREPWTLRGQQVEVPFLHVEGRKVWGATAMMLGELLALFR